MTQSLKFVLDSNVFMEAHRRYYAFDFAPCFWRVLLELAEKGLVISIDISIDRVKDEIMKSSQKDALYRWAVTEFSRWFAPTQKQEVIDAYRQLLEWAMGESQYFDYAKEKFAD